jgi:hypothetical protein
LSAEAPTPKFAEQGQLWTQESRKDFYSRDQGSRIMPLAWIEALKTPDGQYFMADGLSRYGYLANPWSDPSGLPVGFLAVTDNGVKTIGMTCSACHTRQIELKGATLRIDGGPAIVDFQSFLTDLDKSVHTVVSDDAAFADFASKVIGPTATDEARKQLRQDVAEWFTPFNTLIQKALPNPPWGPSRLDAVSMIFNRVAGLDIGSPPTHLIANNIAAASAPVRYPFLWNAPIQDVTQWPGFAQNGDMLLALSRNLGEVFGVFGVYRPKKTLLPGLVDYLDQSSANIPGLFDLETQIKKIEPPAWPGAIDQKLATAGKEIFDRQPAQGGCGPTCHEIKDGQQRVFNRDTWLTPQWDVGTDSKEYEVLVRTADTGALNGAFIPIVMDAPLKPRDKIVNILAASVLGSILQEPLHMLKYLDADPSQPLRVSPLDIDPMALGSPLVVLNQKLSQDLKGAYKTNYPDQLKEAAPFKFEARVLKGIWATAPYLHNGSVPTLAELLKPPAARVDSFKIGPSYDLDNVGLAKEQTKFDFVYQTTDCSKRNSGNSRCGHEFGTQLGPDEKRALLEYLKQL